MKYEKEKDYCSMSPEGMFGVRFNYACYLHDRQYQNLVKNRKTRAVVDKELGHRISTLYARAYQDFRLFKFKSSNRFLILFRNHVLGRIIGFVYSYAVKIFCSTAWILEDDK